jgi:predicted RNase H-like HicB family nuclease
MNFDVLITKQPEDGFIARPVLWPLVEAQGATEQEAIHRVKRLLRDLINHSHIVQIKIDADDDATINPWLATAGMFVDDPDWDDFLAQMKQYRDSFDQSTDAI